MRQSPHSSAQGDVTGYDLRKEKKVCLGQYLHQLVKGVDHKRPMLTRKTALSALDRGLAWLVDFLFPGITIDTGTMVSGSEQNPTE